MLVKLDHFPRDRGEKKMFETTMAHYASHSLSVVASHLKDQGTEKRDVDVDFFQARRKARVPSTESFSTTTSLASIVIPWGCQNDVTHKKNPSTFHYTGWLIGILIMVYYNPYLSG